MVTSPRAYLDHAATTTLRPAAQEAFLRASALTGNPSSVHTAGRTARRALDDALEEIAELLQVPPRWILLTSGGTEGDNLAVRAAALGVRRADASRTAIAVAATEHPAVLATARSLAQGPAPTEVREMPVGRDGLLRPEELRAALEDGAVSVVSAALVNNETGAVQDIEALSRLAREHGTLVHTDAVQAVGHVALPGRGTADLMTLSGHKIGAPVGVGVLVADPDVPLEPLSTGGGQQRGVRSGTLDAAQAAAFAAALRETLADRAAESERLRRLGERLLAGVRAADASAEPTLAASTPRSEHIIHLLFPGTDTDALLYLLDAAGVDASAGSACAAGVVQASPVLAAMGVAPERARGALRISLGWSSTAEDVEHFVQALPEVLRRARAVGAL